MRTYIKIILFSVLFISCATVNKDVDYSEREFSIEALRRELSDNSGRLKTLEGSGKIMIESESSYEEANAKIYMKFPDSLMIKLEGPLGIDLALIFAGGGELKYYNIKENKRVFI